MDFKFAIRSFLKNPAFTILAVTVMALGIGANTAVFSTVNAVLLKPLPYPEPERIVYVSSLWKKSGLHGQASGPDFHDWHDQSKSFSAMAYEQDGDGAVSTGQAAIYGRIARVTPELLDVFQVQPAVGRWFSADETKPNSGGAAVISNALWQEHYGGSASAIGQTVRVYDRVLTIVGVLPAGFGYPNSTAIWIPANTILPETTSRGAHNYVVVARLKPGVDVASAQAEMTAMASRLEQLYPSSNVGKSALVVPMRDELVGDVKWTLYLMLAAVAVVLLISCANVANLLLAKATSRTREIAIRAAVGASRARIMRQLITESMILAVVAGAFGLLLAYWGAKALVAVAPANLPRVSETGFDGWVLAFTFAVSLAASLLFGLAPAIQISRVDLNEALKQSASRMSGGGAGRLRATLVVAEIALSVVLLSGAGLLIRSFVALQQKDLGFRPTNVLVMEANVPATDLESAKRGSRYFKNVLAEVASLPGVISSGAVRIPPGRVGSNGGYWIDHMPADPGVNSPQAVFSVNAPGGFATLGIPLKDGRDFSTGDTFDAPGTAIVNEALVKASFAGQNPIGRVIFCGYDTPSPMTIVGVVGDVRQYGPSRLPLPEIYMPYEQHPRGSTTMRILVRTAGGPSQIGALTEAMRQRAQSISPDVPLRFTTMDESLARVVATPRFRTLLVGIFAALAVCLAMAGVYGVMAYTVSQRVNEIGLRMALGANRGHVLRMVLGDGMRLGAIGLAIGLAGAAAATRLLTTMLFEVKPADPLTYVGVAGVIALMAMSASFFPAYRATRVDPLVALRQE